MYNLFVKDFYLIRKHLWIGFFYSFLLFFMFSPQAFEIQGMVYTMGITMIGYTMIMYTTAYDDKNNSEVLLNSLPISRAKIILARYLSILIFIIIGTINMFLAGLILKSIRIIDVSRMMKLQDFIGAVVGLSILSFLYLPTYFKFGYVKAKMFNLLLFAIGFGGPVIMRNFFAGAQKPLWIDKAVEFFTTQSSFTISLFLLVIVGVIGAISYGVSLMVYSRREF